MTARMWHFIIWFLASEASWACAPIPNYLRSCAFLGGHSQLDCWQVYYFVVKVMLEILDLFKCCINLVFLCYHVHLSRMEMSQSMPKEMYSCSKCNRSYSEPSELANHIGIHAVEMPSKSTQCKVSFTPSQELEVHESTHSDLKPIKCLRCSKSFTPSDEANCESHGKSHKGGRCYTCPHCSEKFHAGKAQEGHKKKNNAEKPLKCSYCDMRFRYTSQRDIHERVHTGDKPFKCTQCHKTFSMLFTLKNHVRIHTGEKPYRCLQCDANFTGKTSLTQHMRIHSGVYPYNCPYNCGKKFRTAASLKRHIVIHTGERPYQCSKCEKRFACKRDLNRHLAVIHCSKKSVMRNYTCTEKSLKCAFCNMKFRYKSQREQHEKLHRGVKPFECTECDKTFAKKFCLTRHLRVHTGEKPYHCPQCNACFAAATTLNQHMRIHNGEYPYNCPYCEKKFRVATTLMRHVFTHTGKNPHKCLQCDKQFASVTGLKRHGVVHSSERPHKCTVCGNSYKRISSLNLHKKVHVKEDHSTDESSTVTIVVQAVLWSWFAMQVCCCATIVQRWWRLNTEKSDQAICFQRHLFLMLRPCSLMGQGGEGVLAIPLEYYWQPVSLMESAMWHTQASPTWQSDMPRVTEKNNQRAAIGNFFKYFCKTLCLIMLINCNSTVNNGGYCLPF